MSETEEAKTEAPDAMPVTDVRGRRRSPVTLPGHRKGMPAPNKGLTLPAEVLSQREIELLLDAAASRTSLDARDRAMVWVLYRVGLKVGQLVALQLRHYDAEAGTLTVPGGKRSGNRVVPLDGSGRELLDEWIAMRKGLGITAARPLFCAVLVPSRGTRLRPTTVRQMLRNRAAGAGIDRRVTPEGLRKSGIEHSGGRASVEGRIEAYVDEPAFHKRYPEAYDKWRVAHVLYVENPRRHATRIGHDCREAMMAFASELAAAHGVVLDSPSTHTIDRVGTVLDLYRDRLGEDAPVFIGALVGYWRAVTKLAQRQEHGASKKTPLAPEDARRVVFQTMLVMYEVDRLVGSLGD